MEMEIEASLERDGFLNLPIDPTIDLESEINRLKREGVRYLIITRVKEFQSHPLLKEYVENNYTLIEEEKDVCLIYKLC